MHAQVHFLGWSEKWDQVFKRSSGELQKLHTFTTPWRQVRQGDKNGKELQIMGGRPARMMQRRNENRKRGRRGNPTFLCGGGGGYR